MLGGGLETGAITECFGQYGSSKTQIAHVLCVSCQAQEEDAVEGDSLAVVEGDSTATDSSAVVEEPIEDVADSTLAEEAVEPEVEEVQGNFFSTFATFFRQGGPAMWAILFFFFVLFLQINHLLFLQSLTRCTRGLSCEDFIS